MRPKIPFGTSAVFLAICLSLAAAEEKPFGIEKFVPVDTSRLMGSPDLLPPLEIEKAFPNLRFERPLQIAHAGDGTHRLFAVTQKGIIYVFPNRPDAAERECKVFLDWSKVAQLVENEEGMMGVGLPSEIQGERTLLCILHPAAAAIGAGAVPRKAGRRGPGRSRFLRNPDELSPILLES